MSSSIRSVRTSLRFLQTYTTTKTPSLTRSFRTSPIRADGVLGPTVTAPPIATVAAPVRRPIGAFRGGIFGFLLGSSVAAYGTYAYVLKEYRSSNEILTEDIYALQAAVQRIHAYVSSLEDKVEAMSKK